MLIKIMEKRTYSKMGLVGKILSRTAVALSTLGFGSDIKQAYGQQPDYNISQREREKNDAFLGAVLGGVLGSGAIGKGTGKTWAQGFGNGISNGSRNLASMSSGDSTQVNVNVNPQTNYTPAYIPQAPTKAVQIPVSPQPVETGIPEIDMNELRAGYNGKRGGLNPLANLMVPVQIRAMFPYKGYIDFNENGKQEFDEFIGVARNQNRNEPINVCVACDHAPGIKKFEARYRTFDVYGNLLSETIDTIKNDSKWKADTNLTKTLKFDRPGFYYIQASIFADSNVKPKGTKTIAVLVH